MAEPLRSEKQVGWQQVLLVAIVVVGVVLGIGLIATLVPAVGDLFDRLPIAILVLVAGTVWVLWQITRRQRTS